MVRTQIQLKEDQIALLKDIASRRHTSVAELIRQAVDLIAKSGNSIDLKERQKRAIAAAGRFRSGVHDLSAKHDRYLSEAYNK